MDPSWHMTRCSAISPGFSDAGKYPQILNLISHPLSFDIEPLLEIICPSSNKACTLYTINFNSFSKSYSEDVVLTMKAIEDVCKSQDDVASYHAYPLWQPREVWCVMCVMCCEQWAERGRRQSRERSRPEPSGGYGTGQSPLWQWLAMPVFASSQCWQCPRLRPIILTLTVQCGQASGNQCHSCPHRTVNTRHCVEWSPLGAPCHQRAGHKRGITLDLVCLRTRVVFNIGSWLLRDSPLFSRRLECVQSLRQWDWPMWRIADSRSIFYFLPRYCWLWWGQGPRTRCCDHGVR